MILFTLQICIKSDSKYCNFFQLNFLRYVMVRCFVDFSKFRKIIKAEHIRDIQSGQSPNFGLFEVIERGLIYQKEFCKYT